MYKKIFYTDWKHNKYFLISDIISAILCVVFSYVIRLDPLDTNRFIPGLILYAFIAAMVIPITFSVSKIYSIYWEYASIVSIIILLCAEVVAAILITVLAMSFSALVSSKIVFPRSIPIIFLALSLILISGPRIMWGLIAYYRDPHKAAFTSPIRRVLIMGAGRAGSLMIGEIRRNSQLGISIMGCLDDNPDKLDKMIHGVKVLGNRDSISFLVNKYNLDEIIITMPSAHENQIRSIVKICRECKVNVKMMRGIYDSCFVPLEGEKPLESSGNSM
jgi:FlaA1/EpsC-like NDP-sugar epimerase